MKQGISNEDETIFNKGKAGGCGQGNFSKDKQRFKIAYLESGKEVLSISKPPQSEVECADICQKECCGGEK